MQLNSPGLLVYLPAGQVLHMAELFTEAGGTKYCPARHCSQVKAVPLTFVAEAYLR